MDSEIVGPRPDRSCSITTPRLVGRGERRKDHKDRKTVSRLYAIQSEEQGERV